MYQSFIGLEIHIQLKSESKIFCSCRNQFGGEPNRNICPTCMGLPGTLPTLNAHAIKNSYALAMALNCELATECVFERKNYFYPDLPKNYQISQFEKPIGKNGYVNIDYMNKTKHIRIRECHLEEDAGKMVHMDDMSLLDYNRTGTPLLEIVTEPDMTEPGEAEVLVHELQRIVRYMQLSDGNMEEGSLRADVNISINHHGQGLGNKVEIKNLNSSRFIRKSLEFEIQRQQECMELGQKISQETRLWNENRDQTVGMRTKENANDYRYLPEPDLPSFFPDDVFLHEIDTLQVELPRVRRKRFCKVYNISEAQASFLCEEKFLADYFEDCLNSGLDPQQVATWLGSDVQKELNRMNLELPNSPLSSGRLKKLLHLLQSGHIHGRIAKQILSTIFNEDKNPEQIIKEKNWERIRDSHEINSLARTVIRENSQAAEDVRSGDSKPLAFLIGKLMKKCSGRIDPKLARQHFEQLLLADKYENTAQDRTPNTKRRSE